MIADTIKDLREKAGYSQAALAKKLNITRSSVNSWEMGVSIPTIRYVVELCQLFRVSSDFLLGLSNEYALMLDGLTHNEITLLYQLVDCFRGKE